ncbi:hypothetical protein CWR43_14330 [Rhizobium sullae]|uniref:Uncharacterized protein n=1 Tax=Rhizobium sullae TaxID=50338 RepID=A0A2N0DAW8_RHISU|nr:hypothetical protein CWR43_14330 [Rhizobium sullae]
MATVQRLVGDCPESAVFQSFCQPRQVTNDKARVRLSRRDEFSFDTEMDFDPLAFEPAPTSRGQMRRL